MVSNKAILNDKENLQRANNYAQLYETEYLNMSQEQISALHEAIDRKEAALAAAEERSSEKQSVLEDLETTKTNPRETKATRKPKKKEETR